MPNGVFASVLVNVPVCSFRKGFAREYLETEDIPPPSTIYGFLLSLVGEEDRGKYVGTQLAYASFCEPQISVVLRTVWRVKDKKIPPGSGNNRRPDFQEILTDVKIGIWLKPGDLANRVIAVGKDFFRLSRFGGLSLGESRDLVNDVVWEPAYGSEKCFWVTTDPKGDLSLPIWVDHVGSKNTLWGRFKVIQGLPESPQAENDSRWITMIKSTAIAGQSEEGK